VPVAPEELFAIAHGVVEGLRELDRSLQRPHGNIKPGNILLERNERNPKNPWLVLLTDPASPVIDFCETVSGGLILPPEFDITGRSRPFARGPRP
jgi:hypothetical protein